MPAGQKRILYIEDDATYSRYILDLFREFEPSLEVFHVSNGAMAWSMLSKGYRPDVIVSAIKMPKMDGPTLLMKVKEIDRLQDIPFVLLSDGPGDVPPKDCGCQADHNLTKPYSTQQFLLMIDKIKSFCELETPSCRTDAPVTV